MYKNLSSEGVDGAPVVYEPIRVMVANRLSEHGSQWAKTFEKHNRFVYLFMFVENSSLSTTSNMYRQLLRKKLSVIKKQQLVFPKK